MGKFVLASTATKQTFDGPRQTLKRIAVLTLSILFGTTSLCGFAAAANTAPTISGTPQTSIPAYSTYRFTPTAKDADGDTLHFKILNRPSWATFSYGTGGLYGTPTQTGTYSDIQIFVTDGHVTKSLPKFSIKVTSASNSAPKISGTPATSVVVNNTYSFKPTASDPDGNTLGFSIANRPNWASFNTATGQLSGKPTSSGYTDTNIIIAVSDGKLTTKLAPFSITVTSASSTSNSAPKISGTPIKAVNVGNAYSFTPTASDANGDKLTFSIANKPSWASFSSTTGKLSGTPTAAQVGTYSNITIKVSDGKATASLAAFAIAVTAVSSGSAVLSWTLPTRNTNNTVLTNLAGYRIYYGTSSSSLSKTISISNASVSTYVVENLSPATYYFAVKAFNSSGVESDLSNKVSKVVK